MAHRACGCSDLGDNVISIIAKDAFDGLDSLEVLSLKENNLRQVEFEAFPPKLQVLGLESNQIDEMPTFAPGVFGSNLKKLCVPNKSKGFMGHPSSIRSSV
jgi:Leucine-rich repeat (LRR) protein